MKRWIPRLDDLFVPRSRRANLWVSVVAEIEGVDATADGGHPENPESPEDLEDAE